MKNRSKLVIRIGISQQNTKKLDLETNFSRSKRLFQKCVNNGAQIITTQECMLDGYGFDDPQFQESPHKYCIPIDHPYIHEYQTFAERNQVVLLIGLSLLEEDHFRNAVVVISKEGKILGTYNKVHSTFGNLEATFYQHGSQFPVFPLTIGALETKFGIMICYDRQMPETARILALRGAEIIFNPAATGNFRHSWNTNLIKTRAYENKCYVVSTNHAAPRINGRSFITNPNGRLISRLPWWETTRVVDLDLSLVRKKQKDLHTRRPSLYSPMLENTQ